MSHAPTMFEFAYGIDASYGKEIPFSSYEIKKLDFSLNIEGYGFAIRHKNDYDLSNVKNIILKLHSDPKLFGFIMLKTEESLGTPEVTIPINNDGLYYDYTISELSSNLREIIFWFPKKENNHLTSTLLRFDYLDLF